MPRVSVIVPAYNAAKFIQPCLDSLAAQTLHDIEVIVVDDGSTDATSEIADRYVQTCAGFSLVSQRNAGVSAARNAGLALARGEFVAFMDADDIAEPVMYERLLELAEKKRLDVSVCNAWRVEDGVPKGRCLANLSEQVQSGDRWLAGQVARRALKHYIWCHLYRRDFLSRNRISFVPGLVHQDIIWTNQVMLAAKRVGCIDLPLYHYRHRPGSLSKPRTSAKRLAAALHYSNVVILLDEIASRKGFCRETVDALKFQAADEGLGIFHIARKLDRADRLFLYATLQLGFGRVLLRNACTQTQKRRAIQRCAALKVALAGEWLREKMFGFGRYAQTLSAADRLGAD
jgi:heptose III glucuronosyltransferase